MIENTGFKLTKATSAVALLLAVAAVVTFAGCPNACNGHGVCGANDACGCTRNWAGSDCTQRVCPFSYAHVTTGNGDNNVDGDNRDNSNKLLSTSCAQNLLSSTVTLGKDLSAAGPLQNKELLVGDGLLVGGQAFVVTAISGTSVTVDRVRATVADNGVNEAADYAAGECFKIMKNQANPKGTFESWVGDSPGHMDAAADGAKVAQCPNSITVADSSTTVNTKCKDEGHYYMECGNRGTCDRKSGECKCFPGYDGAACQRTVCPNDCSGHGTCEKVSELTSLQPKELGCYVSGARGVATLTLFKHGAAATGTACGLADGDMVYVGDDDVAMTISSGSGTDALTMVSKNTKTFPFGTTIKLKPKYSLWDADKNRACKCDSGFSGFDCSERKCPFGDDPLSASQQYETQFIDVGGVDPKNKITGSFKLTFEDMFGEKWTTASIPVDGATDKTADVKAAILALPNEVVQDATVTFIAISDKGVRYMVKFNGGATATATGNSGDLPTMSCDASGLVVRLADASIGGSYSGVTYTFTADTFLLDAVMVGDLVTDGTNDFTVVSVTFNNAGDKMATATLVGIGHSTAPSTNFQVLRKIANSVECTVSDTAPLIAATWLLAPMTGEVASNALVIKSDGTAAAADSANLAVGDKILLVKNDDSSVQQIVTVSRIQANGAISTVEALTDVAAAKVYRYGKGTNEKLSCSGRGLCDVGSGTCKCFKGYTLDDCSRQNALAL